MVEIDFFYILFYIDLLLLITIAFLCGYRLGQKHEKEDIAEIVEKVMDEMKAKQKKQ